MKIKNTKIKYISFKIPASISSYREEDTVPLTYTEKYLKKHAKKLCDILYTKVPSTVYQEVINILKIKTND